MVKHTTFVNAWVEAYNKSGTAQDVARRLNLDISQVRIKAGQLRKSGVQLPVLQRANNNRLDVEALNQFIEARTA